MGEWNWRYASNKTGAHIKGCRCAEVEKKWEENLHVGVGFVLTSNPVEELGVGREQGPVHRHGGLVETDEGCQEGGGPKSAPQDTIQRPQRGLDGPPCIEHLRG